ncbi:N-acetylmuramate alpha-1-phosphate uridylyltransferase MurU [Methylophaga thiooxydans]|uniref:N-acetylmuramate alpha-1-phosphate uridylyltransferase MurU n=1 Tax=Methylophaga thiooxydans TaxID=392484 RepID=UPI0023567320|nr:nucleotidyltransferase family protein [Methylophaga thiooxydans]
MKAMILAAGRGQRLRPLTDTTPKPLIHAGDKRLIEYLIEALVSAGFSDIVINYAHLGEQFPIVLGDGEKYGATFHYSPELDGGLETAGGIINALPLLGNEPFLVVNGDIWTDFNFASLKDFTLAQDTQCHLVLVNNPEHNTEGDFSLGQDGQVQHHGEDKLTFSGIGIYKPAMFTGLDNSKRPLKPLFDAAIQQNQVSGQIHHGQWSDIGTLERLNELTQQLENEKL